jgi:hypothetical protein
MSVLRAMARFALVVGAIGAVAMILYIGRRNSSYWLLVLFAGWDVAPFLGLGVADVFLLRRSAATRVTLYLVTLVVAVASLGLYADVIMRPRPQPAARFLMVPVASWLLLLTAVPLAAYLSDRRSRA